MIDAAGRAALWSARPYNAGAIDLPPGEEPSAKGALAQDSEPSLWALTQDYEAPTAAGAPQAGGRTVKVVRLTGPVPALVLALAVRR